MKLTEFTHQLETNPDAELRFALPDGELIEAHAHITEVGRVDKSFIDCGGKIWRLSHVSLQAWVADDVDHRLRPRPLANIIAQAAPLLGSDDLDVEIEHEGCVISQYPVESATIRDGALVFQLTSKHTACLAQDVCLPGVRSKSETPASESDACCSSGGCC